FHVTGVQTCALPICCFWVIFSKRRAPVVCLINARAIAVFSHYNSAIKQRPATGVNLGAGSGNSRENIGMTQLKAVTGGREQQGRDRKSVVYGKRVGR